MKAPVKPAEAGGPWPSPQFIDPIDAQRLIYAFRHERSTGSIVQLIAGTTGEGTSSLVRDLALVAARVPGARVLLLDIDPPGNRQINVLRNDYGIPVLSEATWVGAPVDVLAHRLALGGLHVTEARLLAGAAPPAWSKMFAGLRTEFDLVLIDSPSIDRAYDGVMLSPEVDTNLLVVEAERTRSAVAQNLRDRVLDVGGAVAGVVLNKQRHYIPGFIYRRI